jgi:hypothetical protein
VTPTQVRTAKVDLDTRKAHLQLERDKLEAEYRLLQRLCSHVNARMVSHMGESCRDCPDCDSCLQ